MTIPSNSNTTSALLRAFKQSLAIPEGRTDVQLSKALLVAYAQNAAREIVGSLDFDDSSDDRPLSDTDVLAFRLAQRLSHIPTALDISVLHDLSLIFSRQHSRALGSLVETTLIDSPSLLSTLDGLLEAYSSTLTRPINRQDDSVRYIAEMRSTVFCLQSFMASSETFRSKASSNKDFMVALAKCYSITHSALASSLGGIRLGEMLQGRESTHKWQIPWMKSKVGLIDTFHLLVSSSLQSNSGQSLIFDILFTILDLPQSSHPALFSPPGTQNDAPPVPFVNSTLLGDYEYAYQLSGTLRERGLAGLDGLISVLEQTSPAGGTDRVGGLILLLEDRQRKAPTVVFDTKGKGKAAEPLGVTQPDVDLDIAISQILDLLPDENRNFLCACLAHPRFEGSAEKVIQAIFDGNIPAELLTLRDGRTVEEPPIPLPATESRRNAFDDDPLDFSQLRIGKKRNENADTLLHLSINEDTKSNILRLVSEQVDSDDEVHDPEERTVGFEEDLDDVMSPSVEARTGSVFDGEGSEDEKEVQQAGPSLDNMLEVAYLRDPKLFDRDGVTRRSKARAELKAQTGWSDEQLEGWRIMLDRDQRQKDKMLQKHEFSGNKPLRVETPEDSGTDSGPPKGPRDGHGRGGGGRGGGRGRGRGEGSGGGDLARDRAHKEKNKNRQRTRGHDRKVARGAAPS